MQDSLCLVYYCSGHGYGHATRVSAFARHLLSVPPKITVHIVSSAPSHVFADSIARGALYRNAHIDPVIVQPLAYRVDRRKSLEALKTFLDTKPALLAREAEWLKSIDAHGVLSDAAFLGCLAAKAAGIPSILITNFSFDSVYSFLSTSLSDSNEPLATADDAEDEPIPLSTLEPLVSQIHQGYQCADRLILLPGYIPMPSFFISPALPSYEWVDLNTGRLKPDVVEKMSTMRTSTYSPKLLHPSVPFPSPNSASPLSPSADQPASPKSSIQALSVPDSDSDSNSNPTHRPALVRGRSIVPAPLIVRPHSTSIYTPEGRSKLLQEIGVPSGDLHDPAKTKILIVSFGGQVIKRPARKPRETRKEERGLGLVATTITTPEPSPQSTLTSTVALVPEPPHLNPFLCTESPTTDDSDSIRNFDSDPTQVKRLATPDHLWIPGAPGGAVKPHTAHAHLHAHTQYTHAAPGVHDHDHDQEQEHTLVSPSSSTSSSSVSSSGLGSNSGSSSGSSGPASSAGSSPKSCVTELTIPNSVDLDLEGEFRFDGEVDGKSGVDHREAEQEEEGDDEALDRTARQRELTRKKLDVLQGHTVGDTSDDSSRDVNPQVDDDDDDESTETLSSLLPKPKDGTRWIAIVCGVSKQQWSSSTASAPSGSVETKAGTASCPSFNSSASAPAPTTSNGTESPQVSSTDMDLLPDGFYVAPKDVYMPDLMAVGDVLLGKLGYGTVSECVDACTPFVYVSRPLFVEEHGLRLLLETEGVGVELSRAAYEAGEWATAVSEAFERGKQAKERKRAEERARVLRHQHHQQAHSGDVGGRDDDHVMSHGMSLDKDLDLDAVELGDKRQRQGRELAKETIGWFRTWWA